MPSVPPDLNIPFNSQDFADAFISKDADDFVRAMKNLFDGLSSMYQDIANAINVGMDFKASDTQPTPDTYRMMVWHDTLNNKYYLMFNDNGTIVKWLSL